MGLGRKPSPPPPWPLAESYKARSGSAFVFIMMKQVDELWRQAEKRKTALCHICHQSGEGWSGSHGIGRPYGISPFLRFSKLICCSKKCCFIINYSEFFAFFDIFVLFISFLTNCNYIFFSSFKGLLYIHSGDSQSIEH